MIITYFPSIDLPLREATRIQYFNAFEEDYKIVFVRNLRFFNFRKNLFFIPLWLGVFFIPALVFYSIFFKIKIFGPKQSVLLIVLCYILRSNWIYTDASDIKNDREKEYPQAKIYSKNDFIPVMEKSLLNRYHTKNNFRRLVRVLFMSHDKEFKGLFDLLRILRSSPRQAKKIHLRICFSQNIHSNLRDMVVRETILLGSIEILGAIDYQKQLEWSDIYYYVYWFESGTFRVPLSLLESIMLGSIPIGPDLPSSRQWLSPNFLVDPSSLGSVSQKFWKTINRSEKLLIELKLNQRYLKNHCIWRNTSRYI